MVLMQVVKNNCLVFPTTVPGAPGRRIAAALREREPGISRHFAARPEVPGKGRGLIMSPCVLAPNCFGRRGRARSTPPPAGPPGAWPAGSSDGALCRVLTGRPPCWLQIHPVVSAELGKWGTMQRCARPDKARTHPRTEASCRACTWSPRRGHGPPGAGCFPAQCRSAGMLPATCLGRRTDGRTGRRSWSPL